jgi:arginase
VLYRLSYLAAAIQSTRVRESLAFRAVADPKPTVAVIGAALDLGQGRRGVDMGPSAMRAAGLEERLRTLGYDVRDLGNVDSPEPEETALEDERARFLPDIKEACARIAGLVSEASTGGEIPLVLGGDHSVALGTLGGLASAHGPGGVLWVDAHPDINTPETSPSGNVHGMPLAAALGLAREFENEAWPLPAVAADRVALIGTRQLDAGERRLLREAGVRVYTMSEIDRIGIERAVRESLDRVAGGGFVHVSFDMDVLDPAVAPGVGTPVRGGLTYREAHLALELVAESGLVGSLEVVEVNPILDRENTTALTAVELVASALGKTIF